MKTSAMPQASTTFEPSEASSGVARADGRAMLNRRQCLLAAGAASGALALGLPAQAASVPTVKPVGAAAMSGALMGAGPKQATQFLVRIEGALLGQGSAHTLHVHAREAEALWLAAPGELHHAVYSLTVSPMGHGPGVLLQWRPHTAEAGACGAAVCNAFDIVLQEGVTTQVPVVMSDRGEMVELSFTVKPHDCQRMVVDASTLAFDA